MAKDSLNHYELSRIFWDFAFENPELVKPIHISIYFFAIEHCNRLGWKEKFGLPTSMVIDAIGMKSYNSYKSHFDDLVTWGFFKVIELSKNQYSSNIIALSLKAKASQKHDESTVKALDKALLKHASKHSESTGSIDKQVTIKQVTNTITVSLFEQFWNLYAKKVDQKKCVVAWSKLSEATMHEIIKKVPAYVKATPDAQFRKNPLTWLNGQCWLDTIPTSQTVITTPPPKYIMQQDDFNTDREYLEYCKKNGITPVLKQPTNAGTLHNI